MAEPAMPDLRDGDFTEVIATDLNAQALVYENQGRYKDAERLYNRAVDISANCRDSATACSRLAITAAIVAPTANNKLTVTALYAHSWFLL